MEDDRIYGVQRLLADYVRSPSLRHIRDPLYLRKLAREIVKTVDRGNSIWTKWDGQREVLLRKALRCWVPTSDLRDALNLLPGPKLTNTDVEQRRLQMEEDENEFAFEEQQEFCLDIYKRERDQGTELTAIVGLIEQQLVDLEERERQEREERYRLHREQERLAREQKLLGGADIGWTQLAGSKCWYCRINGRTFRLEPAPNKRWHLSRVNSVDDSSKADVLGTYGGRADASKALKDLAYMPEPRW